MLIVFAPDVCVCVYFVSLQRFSKLLAGTSIIALSLSLWHLVKTSVFTISGMPGNGKQHTPLVKKKHKLSCYVYEIEITIRKFTVRMTLYIYIYRLDRKPQ